MNQYNDSSNEEQITIRKDGKVFLKLAKSFAGQRCIGWIAEGCFHTERNPEQHLFRSMNAYGFNHALMRKGGFERVLIHTPAGNLESSRQVVLDYGKFLHFKREGFERQIFLRLEDFGKAPKGVVLQAPPVSLQLPLFGNQAA